MITNNLTQMQLMRMIRYPIDSVREPSVIVDSRRDSREYRENHSGDSIKNGFAHKSCANLEICARARARKIAGYRDYYCEASPGSRDV